MFLAYMLFCFFLASGSTLFPLTCHCQVHLFQSSLRQMCHQSAKSEENSKYVCSVKVLNFDFFKTEQFLTSLNNTIFKSYLNCFI